MPNYGELFKIDYVNRVEPKKWLSWFEANISNKEPSYFNLLSLLLFKAGKFDLARELCTALIRHYMSRKETSAFAIQPYINIGRQSIFKKDFDGAKKYIHLYDIYKKDGQVTILNRKIDVPKKMISVIEGVQLIDGYCAINAKYYGDIESLTFALSEHLKSVMTKNILYYDFHTRMAITCFDCRETLERRVSMLKDLADGIYFTFYLSVLSIRDEDYFRLGVCLGTIKNKITSTSGNVKTSYLSACLVLLKMASKIDEKKIINHLGELRKICSEESKKIGDHSLFCSFNEIPYYNADIVFEERISILLEKVLCYLDGNVPKVSEHNKKIATA